MQDIVNLSDFYSESLAYTDYSDHEKGTKLTVCIMLLAVNSHQCQSLRAMINTDSRCRELTFVQYITLVNLLCNIVQLEEQC